METIKYCSKNDKLGTKKVYQDVGVHFPDVEQQHKGCLSECKTCRRQPFVKIGKKQMLCSDSPKQLYKQLAALISQSVSETDLVSKKKPNAGKSIQSGRIHYQFNPRNQNELTLSLNAISAAKLAKKIKRLQQSGESRKMKAVRYKKTSSVKAKFFIAIAENDIDQLEVKKNKLILHLTAPTLQQLQTQLTTYIQNGNLSATDPYTLKRAESNQEIQMQLIESGLVQDVGEREITQSASEKVQIG